VTWLWVGGPANPAANRNRAIFDTDLRGFGHIRQPPSQRASNSLPAASLRLRYGCALQRRPRSLHAGVHYDVQASQMWLRPLTLEGMQSCLRAQTSRHARCRANLELRFESLLCFGFGAVLASFEVARARNTGATALESQLPLRSDGVPLEQPPSCRSALLGPSSH